MSLVVDSLRVAYDGVAAVDDVTLEVATGEIVAIVGPSGSGKSTLLRAVAGLEPSSSGRVLVGGRDLNGVPPHRRGVGLMFQDHALFVHRTVAANVAYGLEVARWSPAKRNRRVDELLELVEMSEFRDRAVDQLSGGESQRVALARALAPRPEVLLLDEPLGSLDRLLRDQLVGDLDRLLRDVGQTALYVTHDQGEAFALADRLTVLASGRVQQTGRPDELWHRPSSGFVARFLGHPNVVSVPDLDQHPLTDLLARRCGPQPLALLPVGALSLSLQAGSPVADGTVAGTAAATVAGTVASCRFNQGVYDVVVVTDVVGLDRLTLRHPEAVAVGARVVVSVDDEAVVALDHRDGPASTGVA